jgi:hypothetical protein
MYPVAALGNIGTAPISRTGDGIRHVSLPASHPFNRGVLRFIFMQDIEHRGPKWPNIFF